MHETVTVGAITLAYKHSMIALMYTILAIRLRQRGGSAVVLPVGRDEAGVRHEVPRQQAGSLVSI